MEANKNESKKAKQTNRNYVKTCIITDCEHHIYNKSNPIKMFR